MLRIPELDHQFRAADIKGIGNIFDEQKPQHRMLVLGGVQGGAQLVGGGPELLFQIVQELFFGHANSGHVDGG